MPACSRCSRGRSPAPWPGVRSWGANDTRAIVGAADVQAGRTTSPSGVVASGNRLVVRFTRPVADFPAQTTMPFFCAVPPTLPADPEGVGAFPGVGPSYVAEYRAGQRVVITRNRFYRGTRPHHVDGFDVDLTAPGSSQAILDRVERGELDWGFVPPTFYSEQGRRLAARYDVNRSQFFLKPGLRLFGFALNTSRPLFRDNARLRRAVNFAIDRRALALTLGGPQFRTSYNVRMRRAARLQGRARLRAYGQLDEQLARDAAPLAPVDRPSAANLVSKRVGCVVLRPELDLTTV